MEYIQINISNKETILELFGKKTDEFGYITSPEGKRLMCPYSNEPIHKDNFSILPGSAIFVNNRPFCFAEHLVNQK